MVFGRFVNKWCKRWIFLSMFWKMCFYFNSSIAIFRSDHSDHSCVQVFVTTCHLYSNTKLRGNFAAIPKHTYDNFSFVSNSLFPWIIFHLAVLSHAYACTYTYMCVRVCWLRSPVRRQKNLRCGRASVVSLLSELPVTLHDPASYVIDVNLASVGCFRTANYTLGLMYHASLYDLL